MKLKILMLAMTLALVTLARGATNDLTGLLQKGLFEEEANRDLTAAIANYQSLANAFDKDRQLAATAVFRLGECYRKLGKTNEAVSQYQRIIKEFSDQQTLVTLSRQNLVGLGGSAVPTVAPSNQGVSEQARQLAWVKKLQAMSLSEVRQGAPTVLTDATLISLIYQYNQTELDLIRLRADYGEEHPEVKKEKAMQSVLQDKIKERLDGMSLALSMEVEASAPAANGSNETGGSAALLNLQIKRVQEGIADAQKQLEGLLKMYMPENSQVVALKKKIDAENANLAALTEKLQAMPSAAAESENPITDEEQQEIRRIQLMIQNSPDLINAPNGANGNETPLQIAATKGQLLVAKYLLDHGADVNRKPQPAAGDALGAPLYLAAHYGHKAMVELLLARGAEVNGAGGPSPLYSAVAKGFTGVVDVLLSNKADVNASGEGKPALHAAVANGKTNLVQSLIDHGADVNAGDWRGGTALELAAMQNETNVAKLLLASKAAVEAGDKEGNTPLHEAAVGGKTAMVSLLLDAGALVDSTNNEDTTPLVLAVANDKTEAARVLLQHKADPNREGTGPDPFSNQLKRSLPILFAIWRGNDDIVKTLLDSGADPNRSSQYELPLFTAVAYNRVGAVQMLLEHGADPNHEVKGLRPLNYALRQKKDARIAHLLLDEGADANVGDSQEGAPLFCTTDPEVGRWLVEHKAAVNGRGPNAVTPLMNTVSSTNYTKFLLEAGANANLQDTNGNTALDYAVYLSVTDSVAMLLAHKADPNIQNNLGYTPRDLAEAGKQGQNLGPLVGWGNFSSPPPKQPQIEIADLLGKAGGLVNLPRRNHIEVRRASSSGVVFTKDSHHWNRYSLLEMIAGEYRLLSQIPAGEWTGTRTSRSAMWMTDLRFPDFKNVVVYRRTDESAKQRAINVNVEDILNSGDCSRDIGLEWGDVIEIPETDHPVDLFWPGLSRETVAALTNCLARQVTIIVKGVRTPLELMPEVKIEVANANDILEVTYVSFMLRSVLDNSKLVRVSSDLSRVKVTRIDPQMKKKQEWTIDCTNPNHADLWLRNGDVIDVPEK